MSRIWTIIFRHDFQCESSHLRQVFFLISVVYCRKSSRMKALFKWKSHRSAYRTCDHPSVESLNNDTAHIIHVYVWNFRNITWPMIGGWMHRPACHLLVLIAETRFVLWQVTSNRWLTSILNSVRRHALTSAVRCMGHRAAVHQSPSITSTY